MNELLVPIVENVIEKTFLGLTKKQQGDVLIITGLTLVVIGIVIGSSK